jgi:hypothetical protein
MLKESHIFHGDSVQVCIEKAASVTVLKLMDYVMYFPDQKYCLVVQYEKAAYHTSSELFAVTTNRRNIN